MGDILHPMVIRNNHLPLIKLRHSQMSHFTLIPLDNYIAKVPVSPVASGFLLSACRGEIRLKKCFTFLFYDGETEAKKAKKQQKTNKNNKSLKYLEIKLDFLNLYIIMAFKTLKGALKKAFKEKKSEN